MSEVLSSDWAELQQGSYIAVNNVWGRGDLQNGVNYTQSIAIDNTTDLSSGIHMDWNWNVDVNNRSVLAYPEISVGYKPWDAVGHGTDALDSRIRDIKTFTISHDLSIGGETDRFNVSYDLWLTSLPLGNQSTIQTELMIWTHNDGVSDDNAVIGTYTQSGTTFDIVKYDDFTTGEGYFWRYIALVPQTDVLDKTVDVKQIFHDLIDRGLISDQEFVTGYELGAEVTGGTGSLDITSMSHSFEVFGANAKANKLVGTATQDRIYGLNGNDTISGKGGSDLLSGGLGSDTLTGGNGKDTFYFDNLQKKADVITDFTRGKDTIGLDADIFTALPAGDWSHGTFKVGRAFGADTHLLYRSSTGQLFYDADGSGTNDTAHLITTLENHAKLIYSDFELL